jgi:cysteine-rich repeat protein
LNVHPRTPCLLALLALTAACGSRRVAGYLEELEDCSTSSSTTGTSTTGSSSSGGDTSSSSDSSGTGSGAIGTSSDTTETGATTDTSTGEPMPTCGNGALEAIGPEPEECDDGNLDPDDGCSETCALDRRVFVSSELYTGGSLGGLKKADAQCANLADDQGWPDGLKYRAWLSDSQTDARDRFKRGRGRLVLANGLVLAQSWSALLAGQLENPLEVTEMSLTYHGAVWTGTRPDGTAVPDAEHCEDWTTQAIFPAGYFGFSDRTMGEWTLAIDGDQPASCYVDFALYCIQSL